MNDVVPAYNEANIEKALLDARGDIFLAAQLMGHVTALKLDRDIRASERLRAVYLTIEQVKADPDYDRLSQERLEAEISRRMTMYRSDALDAMHALAVMPVGDNSAMMQVKLSAATKLSGGVEHAEANDDMGSVMRELNERYHKEAPRLKVTRERMTVEVLGGAEMPIEGSARQVE